MGREKFLISPSILDQTPPSRWTPRRPVKHCPMRPTLLFLLLACLLAGCERSAPLPVAAPPNLPRLRELDFSPFAESLDRIGSRRLAKIERLVASSNIPEVPVMPALENIRSSLPPVASPNAAIAAKA